MKKVLALVLALLMIVSCLPLMVFAADEETERPHEVVVSGCNMSAKGWGGFSVDIDLKQEGISALSNKFEAGKKYSPNGSCQFSYTSATPIDISGYSKLKFSLYVSDPAVIADKIFAFELTSGGTCDVEEGQMMVSFNDMVPGGVKQGWNEVDYDLSKFGFGGCDKTRWNYFRMYNSDGFTAGAEDLVVAIDNFRFDDTQISSCDFWIPGWTGVDADTTLKVDTVNEETGKTTTTYANVISKTLSGAQAAASTIIEFHAIDLFDADEEEPYFNVSTNPFLVFDVYVSNVEVAKNMNFCLELASSGTSDKEEANITTNFYKMMDGKLVEGWNHVVFDTRRMNPAGGPDGVAFDSSMLNYIRIYNVGAFDAGESFKFALENVKFWDGITGEADGQARETITFDALGENASNYRSEVAPVGQMEDFFFADATGYIVLTYKVANAATAKNTTWIAKLGSDCELSCSMNGTDYTTFFACNGTAEDRLENGYRVYDLTEYVNFAASDTLYIRIGDTTKDDGNGGKLFGNCDTILDVVYDIPEVEDPHNPLISNCDTTTGWHGSGPKLNKKDKLSGTGCIEYVPTGIVKNPGQFMMEFHAAETRTKFFDTTGMKALVFDFYCSNAAVFSGLKLEFELTSSGTCDHEENSIFCPIGDLIEGGLKDGWNKVILPFDKINNTSGADGGLKREAWNYLRIFNHDSEIDAGEGITVRVDNLHFWDGDDGSLHETYSFKPLSTEEAPFLDPNFKGSEAADCRFNDVDQKTIYKFDIKNIYKTKAITFSAKTAAQYLLEYSVNGKDWIELDRYVNAECETAEGASKGADAAIRTYDLTDKINLQANSTIYIRMGDSYPATGGWGGNYRADGTVSMDVTYFKSTNEELDTLEMQGDEHSVPLFGCNSVWGSGKVDKELKKFGSGCVKFTYTASNINQLTEDVLDVHDCTGMDTLEFWIYLSDESMLSETFPNANLEITSSGGCDNEETCWTWNQVYESVEGGIKAGEWCHVYLPVAQASGTTGETNWSAINYIRFFWLDLTEPNEDYFIAIDNICMTDRQAQLRAAAKQFADPVISIYAALDVTTKITTDALYQAAKKAVADADAAYKKLDSVAQSLVSEDAAYKNKNTLNSMIKSYEKVLNAIDLINALKGVTITADNKAEMEDKIDSARKAYDKLKDDASLVSADVLKVLTDAEAALAAVGGSDTATTDPTGSTGTTEPTTPGDDTTTIIIIVVVVVVVVAAGVCLYLFVFKKKK